MQDRHRVLVVNDDPELLQSRCGVLQSLGLRAIPALGVTQAGEMSAREQYEAVLVDATNVSFHHAIRLCGSIKQNRPEQKIILIISSHHVMPEDAHPDVVLVREHPDEMWPKVLAAVRGDDVPVDDEMAPEDTS